MHLCVSCLLKAIFTLIPKAGLFSKRQLTVPSTVIHFNFNSSISPRSDTYPHQGLSFPVTKPTNCFYLKEDLSSRAMSSGTKGQIISPWSFSK